MNYLYSKLRDAADYLYDREMEELADDFAKVLHDAEWWHSADISEDTYRATVKQFKEKWFKASRDERLKRYINEEIERAKKTCLDLLL